MKVVGELSWEVIIIIVASAQSVDLDLDLGELFEVRTDLTDTRFKEICAQLI